MTDSTTKVALVTGGAKRVGRAIVEKLAQEGFSVAFTYNTSEDEANELARRIDGHAIRADLFQPEQAAEAIATSFATYANRLDVLVNSASAYVSARLLDTDMELMRKVA